MRFRDGGVRVAFHAAEVMTGERIELPEALREFAAQLGRGEFWEAHETLEAPWRRARSGFYKGLILLASAWVHARRGNPRGVAAQLRKAERELAAYRPAYLGVDVDSLLEHSARVLAALAADPAAVAGLTPPGLALDPGQVRGDEPELTQPA